MRIMTNVKDVFELPKGRQDAVCINTNGMTAQNGHAVMGAGMAKDADDRFVGLSETLGTLLRSNGNHTYYIGGFFDSTTGKTMTIFTFPTKNDWRNGSDLTLIEQSAKELVLLVTQFGIENCYLAAPGCGLGGLDWETQVRPVLEPILDDRFVVVFR